jgi:hypothetical protein
VGGRFSATAIIVPGARRLLLAQRFYEAPEDQKQGHNFLAPLESRLKFDGIKLTIMQATHYTGSAFIH